MSSDLIVELKDSSNWDEVVTKSALPVCVDFYADWCGPCKALAPLLKNLVEDKKTFKLVKVNVDDCSEIAEKYEIQGLPTIKFFKEGEVIGEVVGNNINGVIQIVEKL
jgi:thioredoxin 1